MNANQNMNTRSAQNTWLQNPALNVIPVQLDDIIQKVITPSGLKMTSLPQRASESTEYGACVFGIEHQKVLFRVAKTTSTKMGQFVTLWKRIIDGGEIEPIDSSDNIDYVIIAAFDVTNRGIFILNKKILAQKNIMSVNGKGGKRALRIYPHWTHPEAKQALETQKWQLQYFLSLDPEGEINLSLFQKILKH